MGSDCMKGADLNQSFNLQMEPLESGEIIPEKIKSRLGKPGWLSR
jgi:hypothetical protein